MAHILYDIEPSIWPRVLEFLGYTFIIVLIILTIIGLCVFLEDEFDFFSDIKDHIKYFFKKKPTEYRGYTIGNRVNRTIIDERGKYNFGKYPVTITKFHYCSEKRIRSITFNDGNMYYTWELILSHAKKIVDPRPKWF